MDASIKLPNNPVVIGAASDFTYKWGLNSGLDHEAATRLSLAVSEIVTDIILFAFGGKQGEFDITFRHDDFDVEVIIHELGEPFDPERHKYDLSKALQEDNFEGAGFELVRHFIDDFLFLNLGREGKEFRLVQKITAEHIKDIVPIEEIMPNGKEDVASGEQYTITPIQPKDAEDISKLIYRTYGHTYNKDVLYFPRKIELALEQNDKFGTITRTSKGWPVGYFAVICAPDSNIGEVGEAVVAISHRRRGIMKRMLRALIDMALDKGLLGLFGEALTFHPISQKVNAHFNFKTTALMLASFPTFVPEGFDDEARSQEVSVVIDFLPLTDFGTCTAYIPHKYRDLVTDIYHNLGATVVVPETSEFVPDEITDIDIQIQYHNDYALIVIEKYGVDFEEVIARTTAELLENEIKTINIDLPLHQPATQHVMPQLEALQFIFSGLMPRFHREMDYLRFQKTSARLDFNLIHVYSEMAKRIKDLIIKETHEHRIDKRTPERIPPA